QQNHRNAEHVKSIESLVVEDLVRKQPPKDDRRKRDKAQNQRANGNVTDDPPLTKYESRYEPKAKWLALVSDFVIALDEDDLAGPGTLEPNAIDDQQRIFVCIRILQYNACGVLLTLQPQQHHAAAVLKLNDCRERLF